jgi:hypothetical protein
MGDEEEERNYKVILHQSCLQALTSRQAVEYAQAETIMFRPPIYMLFMGVCVVERCR